MRRIVPPGRAAAAQAYRGLRYARRIDDCTGDEDMGEHGISNGLILLIILALTILPFWKIFSKAGYSGAWSLLMLVPLVNVLAIWIFAFSDWPVRRGQR